MSHQNGRDLAAVVCEHCVTFNRFVPTDLETAARSKCDRSSRQCKRTQRCVKPSSCGHRRPPIPTRMEGGTCERPGASFG